uniref:T9SS type A sorting domain-containing protein n=1 Tax=candidate division WOR-3 bacterium TaxID=2052148 RepID=A0A7C4CCH2_UNCW3
MKTVLLTLSLLPTLSGAGVIEQTLTFRTSDLQLTRHLDYDVVALARGYTIPDPGRPSLPLATITVVIPADAELTGVEVIPLQTEALPGRFNILPAQPPQPLSSARPQEFVPPDPTVYSGTDPFPAACLAHHSTGRAGGFRLAAVTFCPFTYIPAHGRLSLHTQLRISIHYRDHAATPQPLTTSQRDRLASGLARLVANPADLAHFAPPVCAVDAGPVDYLVITSSALANDLRPLLEYRTRRGLRAELRTVEWISANYPGRDMQEKIRNCIRDYFTNRGLGYVLLAGDNAQVPGRRICVSVGNEQGEIPTDLYYADLDFSWDSNHNNRFGEMDDSVDFYADVFLGRASVDNSTQAQTFLTKLQTYETNPASSYIKRSLLPSGWLWRSLNYHGRFVNDSIAAITPAGWTDRKLENPSGARVVADSFEHGFALFDPAGHGNSAGVYDEDGTPIYTTGVAGSQRNDRMFSIMTSLACTPGDFEAEDCLAEVSHNCPQGGSIGVMMNSRYGWGTPPSIGPSELLCIRFYDFLLQRDEHLLSHAHSHSREVYADAAQWSSLWRWCMTEFNLFGDPAIDIWTAPPTALDLAAAETVATGRQNIVATVTSSGSPLAGVRVCAWKPDETFAVGYTGSNGQVELDIRPFTPGTLQLTATAHDRLPATKDIVVIPGVPEPHLVYRRHIISDQGQPNENGILEPGETGSLTIIVRNAGTAALSNASLVLRSTGSSVSILDSLSDISPVPAGDSAAVSGLLISVRPDAMPGSAVELVAYASAAEGSWDLPFIIELGYPGRVVADIDTGECALTIGAGGTLGYDATTIRQGRGFRFPKTDTSCLRNATFCLALDPEHVIDRFYNTSPGSLDADWRVAESLYASAPLWGADEILRAAFTDAGHARPLGLRVEQKALGLAGPNLGNSVIIVYDVVNQSSTPLTGLRAGILADFDIRPTDPFHDLAGTIRDLNTAFMRSVAPLPRSCGVKLLSPSNPGTLACLDHGRYVYPDSGLSEDMKFRLMSGSLGLARSDRPFNWSVAVGSAPFDLAPTSGRQRLGFALIATQDSASYAATCTAVQEWFDANVAITEPAGDISLAALGCEVIPNPVVDVAQIRFATPGQDRVVVGLFDAGGRQVELIHSGPLGPGQAIVWRPSRLPAGVYFLRAESDRAVFHRRVTVVR